MEPLPETREALRTLSSSSDRDLEVMLEELASAVLGLVPSCVGLSITLRSARMTFTAASSSALATSLDGVQYVDGGPCVETATAGVEVDVADVLDEDRWQLYATAAAAGDVRSSLSLPLLEGGELVGGVNLYASEPGGFEGRHDALRRLLASPGATAVLNGDLSFRTLDDARSTPRALEELAAVDRAVGFLAAMLRVDVAEARHRLDDAAARAGAPVAALARVIVGQAPGALR